jgi:hypothetical protein
MRYITAAIAMASGLIVLAGYLYPLAVLTQMRGTLTDWVVIIAAWAALVGIINMLFVQLGKIRTRQKNSMYGVFMVLSLILTFGLGMALTPAHATMHLLMDAVIVPVEAALMAILTVTLVYASIRLLRRRTDVMTVIFLLVAVFTLIALMPTPIGPVPGDWIILQFVNMFSSGGARGLLIGVALGTLLTSLRVLFGIDRPYGGN